MLFYLYNKYRPWHNHDHELFFIILDIIFMLMPRCVIIEMGPPQLENYADYLFVLFELLKLGYSTYIMAKPVPICGHRVPLRS